MIFLNFFYDFDTFELIDEDFFPFTILSDEKYEWNEVNVVVVIE